MSKYIAYPFLYDDTNDLRCDFEILTDEISSMIGFLRSFIEDESLKLELSKINELVYHTNPSLRTMTTVTKDELLWLEERTLIIKESVSHRYNKFVLPEGCTSASLSHVIRVKCKSLVRLLSRYQQQGNKVDQILFDFCNLFSGYFFYLALKLNDNANIEEMEYISRNYK